MQERTYRSKSSWKSEPIAVVGSGCRLPGGVRSPSQLWELLKRPKDLLRDISPVTRFNTCGFYNENGDHHGTSNVAQSYLCDEDLRAFDHEFFGIHAGDAEAMDPQQRILLEVVYEAIEAAGYSMEGLKGSQTGVFVGQMTDDYRDVLYRDVDNVPRYAATGISRAITANRVSYVFDWHGPSVNMDTACSSSLVALHQAVQALRNGESTLAVAAGVNLILGPEMFIMESKLHMLSPTGRCRMWDASADGYARGEGTAAVVLKTLRQALADGDHIECVVRETGAALIKSTYARCDLDPSKTSDRCQYFEAHGTGTAAGDPKEAQAIRDVFYQDGEEDGILHVGSVKTVLGHSEGAAGLVALLKASLAVQHAVIPPNMHFERISPAVKPFYYPHLRVPTEPQPWPEIDSGTARRASVNGFGFGGTNAHAIIESWDQDGDWRKENKTDTGSTSCGPFIISANSPPALTRQVTALSGALKRPDGSFLDMQDLAWTLQSRRTELPYRAGFSAATKEGLVEKLDLYLSQIDNTTPGPGKATPISTEFPLRILAVFTGQGAQWPRMGASLFEHSPLVRRSIQQLDESLSCLPSDDAPTWLLADALLAPSAVSRVREAAIAQPLTTALQIALVDLLRAAGVHVAIGAVVGHSSGEIAAAYAAGYLSASDAIRISYYRGMHASRAARGGSMMAVGMSMDEAKSFCQGGSSSCEFAGRITVAASNSPSSVTLSGDTEAIHEAKAVLDQRGTFARVLQVDTAYHSHLMQPCVEAYVESLGQSAIQIQRTAADHDSSVGGGSSHTCTWYSSVHGTDGRSIGHNPDALRGRYWADNMVRPVLFYEAVERAVREDDRCFDFVLEIGPHSALRGPVTDAFKKLTGMNIPYASMLKRSEDDRVAVSDAFACLWTKFQGVPSIVDWVALRKAVYGHQSDDGWQQPRLIKDLPPYIWDHEKPLLFESQKSKAWRTSSRLIHPLLGRAIQHGNGRDTVTMTWRNILKLSELEWLRGHQFQHQIVFPAAGYVSMATDAAYALAEIIRTPGLENNPPAARLIELTNMHFYRAITLEETSPVEISFIVRSLRRTDEDETALNFSGRATITLGSDSPKGIASHDLPERTAPDLPLSEVDTTRFYSWASSIGLQYSGDFLVESIRRRRNMATVVLKQTPDGDVHDQLRVHPATFDTAIHGIFAAHSFPGDGRMSRPHLPSAIDRVRVVVTPTGRCPCQNELHTYDQGSNNKQLVADCHIQQQRDPSTTGMAISGDVDVFCAACEHPLLQVEGFTVSRLSRPSARDDRALFSRTIWNRDLQSCGIEVAGEIEIAPNYREDRVRLSEACDRTAYFYLRQLCNRMPSPIQEASSAGLDWNIRCLMDWAFHIVEMVESGRHPRVRAEWAATNTPELIEAWRDEYARDYVEMKLIHTVGQRLPSLLGIPASEESEFSSRPKGSMSDTLMEDDMLPRLYHHAEGFHQANNLVGLAVGHLAHRYPNLRILEIGGGTGSATVPVLAHLGDYFASYTFTDISAAFFHDAKAKFAGSPGADRMRFAVLDIEQDPCDSGEFEEHTYDLIIASNVLHATRSLAETVANCRRLLVPGGFLILDEATSDTLWGPFIVSALPGWWLGREGDGRVYSPLVSEQEWDRLLRENGFSGVDHVTRDTQDDSTYMFSVIVSQAVDSRVDLLRTPLLLSAPDRTDTPEYYHFSNLVIVGGKTGGQAAHTASEMRLFLEEVFPRPGSITVLDGLEALTAELEDEKNGTAADSSRRNSLILPGTAVMCLSALDDDDDEAAAGIWHTSEAKLHAMQAIFRDASYVLWVTQGDRTSNPRASMMVGLGRTVMCESPHLRLLFVNIENDDDKTSQQQQQQQHHSSPHVLLTEMLLRMGLLDRPEYRDVLWTNETELAVRQKGGSRQVEVFIPRVKPDDWLNRRLASATRRVEEDVAIDAIDAGAITVKIDVDHHHDRSSLALRRVPSTLDNAKGSDGRQKMVDSTTHFKSYCSSLFAFVPRDGARPLYICLALKVDEPGKMAICVSTSNASSFKLAEGQWKIIPETVQLSRDSVNMLRRVITTVVCESFLTGLSGTLWLHNVPAEMGEATLQMGKARGIHVFLSTSSAELAAASFDARTATLIHPRSSRRKLESIIPADVKRLVLMGDDQNADNDVRSLKNTILRSGILATADIRYLCQDLMKAMTVYLDLDVTRLWEIITMEANSSGGPFNSGSIKEVSLTAPSEAVVDLASISSLSGYHRVTTIVDWTMANKETSESLAVTNSLTSTKSISVTMQPLESEGKPLFSPYKTYLLVGLAGDLGMSLVEWMASTGAQHFAIVSRNPQISHQMLSYLNKRGVNIHTWALDVADKEALFRAYTDMIARMPPIGGVANGAMVLRDRPFGNMAADDFEFVLRPKAIGTHNLDELFHADLDLEFFILFASGTCVVGNAGQANYSAANMFMASVAEQRRQRGVAASVIYLGTVLGVGHVARSLLLEGNTKANNTRSVESQLQRFSQLPLSEEDLHTAFAEAVVSGRPNSNIDPGLIVGLGDGKDAPWRSLPRFSSWLSHLLRRRRQQADENIEGFSGRQDHIQQQPISIRDELVVALDTCTSQAAFYMEANTLLQEAFTAKLSVILQTPTAKIDKSLPLVALGFDSLVAVEVRSWVLRELSIDVPVLKMLGGSSLADICRDIVIGFAANNNDGAVEETLESEPSTGRPRSLEFNYDEEDVATSATSTPSPSPSPLPSATGKPEYVRVGDMSPAQARLYFLHRYLEDKSAYTIGYVGKYHGYLDVGRLHKALWTACRTHESLRSCYFMDSAASHRAVQAVLTSPRPAWEYRQIQDESEVWRERESQKRFVFDIEHGSTVKVTILSLSPVLHHIIFLHHHIALDGMGWFLFFKDLEKAYSGQELVSPVQQSIDMSLKQLLHTQKTHQHMQPLLAFWGGMHQDAHEPLPLFPFSKVKNRKVLNKYETETLDMELDPSLAKRVKLAAAALGVTPFHFYLSALAVFLTRCLDDVHDFSIGIVDANRPDADDGSTMGYFLNMLPLRFRLDLDENMKKREQPQRFDELAKWCRDTVLKAHAAQIPFDAILDQVQTSRSGSHHPLFQVALDYRQGYSAEDHFGGGTIRWDAKQSITARNPYDIFINVTQASPGDHTYIHWTTQKYMYGASDSGLMVAWYTRILDALAHDPSLPIISCPVATEADLRHAVELGTGKPVDEAALQESSCDWDDNGDTLIHRVDRVACQYPTSIALLDDNGGRLTYSDMMIRIQHIARCLKQVLLQDSISVSSSPSLSAPPVAVATLIHPANDYVCCLLAILRLGLTCLGLDLRNPDERLAIMTSDCAPRVLVCTAETRDQTYRLAASLPIPPTILDLDLMDPDMKLLHDGTAVENTSSLDQRAVVLYTSGSTGVPKGVLLSHRNLLSHIRANTALFGLGRDDVILQQTSPGFDFCLDQIFHALANGGVLVVVGRQGRGDPARIAALMLEHGVTCTVGCPSEYLALLNYGLPTLRKCSRWRLAFSGGEKLTIQLRHGFRKLRLEDLQLINVYGPTEVTIACARGRVPYRSDDDDDDDDDDDRVVQQVGDYLFPMPGYSVLVIDRDMNLLPAGFPGEIYIAGDGVALGYLNRPAETRRGFLEMATASPLLSGIANPKTLYRSGDHGRLLQDGSINLLGRVESGSSQVKIRGMRVELDEVANMIMRESGDALSAAAVSYRHVGDSGRSMDLLVAFVVFDLERKLEQKTEEDERRAGITQRLRTSLPLPAHMCPSHVVPVDRLPTNVNGKLDRAAVDRLPIASTSVAVRQTDKMKGEDDVEMTSLEQRMKLVWCETLELLPPPITNRVSDDNTQDRNPAAFTTTINADSDFFQVGGSSMLAIKLRAVIRGTFGVTISLPELFRLRTMGRMAARVAAHNNNDGAEPSQEPRESLQSKMDWAAEVAALFDGLALSSSSSLTLSSAPPPRSSQVLKEEDTPPTRSTIKVLLTGATGFLGRHILRQLISDTRVSQIHCVAVRRQSTTVSSMSDKIISHAGDLGSPLLGLSRDTFTILSQSVDVIIHNGARVSFLEPYDVALRAPNVLSTRSLCALALPRRIPLHFVSSAAVAGVLRSSGSDTAAGPSVLAPVSVADCLPPPSNGLEQQQHDGKGKSHNIKLDGYSLSKWVGEALLEKVSAELGLPTFVHRVASLVGDGAPARDIMDAMIRFSRMTGSVPALQGSRLEDRWRDDSGSGGGGGLQVVGAFDWVPVERVGQELVRDALESVSFSSPSSSPSSTSSVSTKFIHHCNDDKVPPSGLRTHLEEMEGRPFGEVAVGDWLDAARTRGLDLALYEYLIGATREGGELYLPTISK
ncbi:hypothetical protein B0T17DRAFT_592263 [Bombardia bombarda]|uniref:Polyketide synthase n=1 Tax=Bombardia bombarda TaxID=252184 RepID=A0AA39WN71_9PEZI|nr:hypothetical protein B0T17DRAFT_592263 [Bombardia bombarda]